MFTKDGSQLKFMNKTTEKHNLPVQYKMLNVSASASQLSISVGELETGCIFKLSEAVVVLIDSGIGLSTLFSLYAIAFNPSQNAVAIN